MFKVQLVKCLFASLFFFCNSVLIKFFYFLSPKELDRDFFRPPSILLHTPVKAGGSGGGWATASTASSLPSTPNRLQGNKTSTFVSYLKK
jgi:hypothetical protein